MTHYSLRKDKGIPACLPLGLSREFQGFNDKQECLALLLLSTRDTILSFLPGVYRLRRGAVTDCTWSDLTGIFEDRVLTPNKADSRWRLCVRAGRGKIRESMPLASSMGPRCRAQKSTKQ